MSKDAVLTLYDDIKRRVLGMTDSQKEPDGILYSMMQVGHPLNAEDFRNPYTPFTQAGPEETPADIGRRQQAAFYVSQFLDHKIRLESDFKLAPVSSKISETWRAIITSSSPPVDGQQAPAAVLKRIEDARAYLMDPKTLEPTPQAKAYEKYRTKVKEARDNYTNAYLTAMTSPATAATWPQKGKNFIDDIHAAEKAWDTYGFRKAVEEKQATISSQGMSAIDATISFAREQFEAWQIASGGTGATHPFTYVIPSDWAEPHAGDSGWHQYGYQETNTSTHHSESSSSWGGGGGVSFGFWSVGGTGGGSERRVHDEFSSSSLGIQMSYGIATIERPWLSTVLLNVKGWGLIGQQANCISTGDKFQKTPAAEAMESLWLPSIPTQMVIVKDVRITSSGIQQFYDYVQKNSGGGASFGWGPFTVSGSSSWASSNTDTSCRMENGWLVVNGAQLIGYILEITPPSPTAAM